MTLRDTVINTVAGTILLAAGGTIVSLKVNDARQDERITRIEKVSDKMDALDVHLQSVDVKLSHLDGRLDGENDRQPSKRRRA